MGSSVRAPGEQVAARYELESLIGRGGIGEVWRARHLILGSHVAIKFLVGPEKGAGIQRFLAEARIAANLKSRHAVQVFDFGVTNDGHPYLVMELLEGESLAERLARGRLSAETTVRLLAQAAKALDHAHELGIVHRDFKPDNAVIVLDRDGNEDLKVVDFGIAKLVGESAQQEVPAPLRAEVGAMATVGVLGTPAYMAPEQVRNKDVGAACDIWALGVVAFQCLTGSLPFGKDEGSVIDLFNAILAGQLPSARGRVADLPEAFDAWLAEACAVDAGRRFPSATLAVEKLGEALGSMPEPPRSASAVPPASSGRMEFAPTLAASETVASPPPTHPTRPRAYLRIGAAALMGVALLGVTVLLRTRERSPSTSAASVVASSEVTPPPTKTILDAPLPSSSSPEAIAAYRAGLAAYREGTFSAIHSSLQRALQLDPGMAQAWLRLAIVDYWNEHIGDSRESFQRATSLRDSLGEHDRELLDAFEPLIGRDPSNSIEFARRMEAFARHDPDDAEAVFYYGKALDERGEFARAVETLHRVTELDPTWAVVRILLGLDLAYLGDVDGALAEYSRCIGAPSSASACGILRARLLALKGRCAEEEAQARDIIAKAPTSPAPYEELANALASLGRPAQAVAETLTQAEARFPEELRAQASLKHRIEQALWQGRFDEAERYAGDLARAVAAAPSESDHAPAARYLLAIALETGQSARAVGLANDYLGRREGWVSSARHGDEDVVQALEVPMLAVLRRAGKLSSAAFEKRRNEWVRGWEAVANPPDVHYVWYQAYAGVAETPEEGRAAMNALPTYAPLPAYSSVAWTGLEGRARLLAGDTKGALPVLESAAGQCRALVEPIQQTHAQFDLGVAYERMSDVASACAAYGAVLDRWGGARPRSVTADGARARVLALGCKVGKPAGK